MTVAARSITVTPTFAQVQKLTRENSGAIRLILNQTDTTAGT